MRRYQTEILIPSDRQVRLQLPDDLPQGRAIVTILIDEPTPAESDAWPETDPDRQDIEWWDEFEDREARDASGPSSRLRPR